MSLPLLAHREPSAIVAWRDGRPLTVRQLLADAHALARALPPATHLLNGCRDRYRFIVVFAAAMLRGQVCVLPNNLVPATLADLARRHPGLHCVSDEQIELDWLPRIPLPEPARPDDRLTMPAADADAIVACLFTSGSTGAPVAHPRRWGTIVGSARAEASRLGLDDGRPWVIVGTVPSQHSYGFESTVQLAMHAGCSVAAEHPFLPADVLATLGRYPTPRLLVTTPVHLRALLGTRLAPGQLEGVLSATAPLTSELASEIEYRTGAPVLEIYGSTESGQVASRRTIEGDWWRALPGVSIGARGDAAWAQGGHVGERVALADHLEVAADGRFRLLGRAADMVNIAGKRSSIAFLDRQLLAVPGVEDAACVVLGEDARRKGGSGGDPRDRDAPGVAHGRQARVAAFVVAPTLSARQVLAGLRGRVESAFLPRPLVMIETLPRERTGKLTRERLMELVDRYIASR